MTFARLPGLLVPLGLCLLVLQVLAPAHVLEELVLVLLGFRGAGGGGAGAGAGAGGAGNRGAARA